jgi:hypothetical protein
VDRNLKKPLGQGRNPGSCLILKGQPDRPRELREFLRVPGGYTDDRCARFFHLFDRRTGEVTGRIVDHLPAVTFRLVLSADGRYLAAILVIAALRQGAPGPICVDHSSTIAKLLSVRRWTQVSDKSQHV